MTLYEDRRNAQNKIVSENGGFCEAVLLRWKEQS